MKVVIVDAEKKPASDVLVTKVQQHLDPVAGQGEGQAPVGAVVTVSPAIGKNISVQAKVTLAGGYTLQAVNEAFRAALEKYRKEKAFTATYMSLSVVGALLLNTEGIVDYTELKLNGGIVNVPLGEEEVPLFNTVTLEV